MTTTEVATPAEPTEPTEASPAEQSTAPLRAVDLDKDPSVVLVDFDLRELTCGQVELIEDLMGASITACMEPDRPQGKFHRAIAYAVRRDTEPDLTFEDAGRYRVFFRLPAPVPPTGENGSAS